MGFFKKLFGGSSEDSNSNYNKSEKDAPIQQNSKPSIKPEVIITPKWNNLFGVDLTSAPNVSWSYEGEDGNSKYFEFRKDSFSDIFESCKAIADGNEKTMNFIFECDFDLDNGYDILWEVEKNIMCNSKMTRDQAVTKYVFRADDEEEPIFFEKDGNRIIYKYEVDEYKIRLIVITKFYNESNIESVSSNTSNGSDSYDSLMKKMGNFEKYEVIVEGTDEAVDYFKNEEWLDDNKPVLMASVLANGKLYALNTETMVAYFEYKNSDVENTFRAGNTGIVAVSGYKIDGNNILVDLWIQYVDSPDIDENSFSAEVKEVECDDSEYYRMWYWIEEEMDSRTKTIKNGNVTLNVAGIRYRENYLDMLDSISVGDEVTLAPEPDNKYDANALAFYLKNNTLLGYLPKKDQPFARLFMATGKIECRISSIDGDYVDTEFALQKSMIDKSAYYEGLHIEKVTIINKSENIENLDLDSFAANL